MTKPTAMFVCYGGGHSKMVAPVAARLKRQGWACPILALTTAGPELRAAGFETIGFADLVQAGDDEALDIGQRLASPLPTGAVPMRESVAYLGLSFAELIRDWGPAEAERRFQRMGRKAFLPMATLGRACEMVHPDVIIATCSPRAEKAALLLARERDIPSVCMVDLLGADSDVEVIRHIAEPGYGSRIAVLGEVVRQYLVDQGRPGHEIAVTGNPAFDKYDNQDLLRQGEVLRSEWGWSRHSVLLFASQPNPSDPAESRRIDQDLSGVVSRHPSWRLIIRPHPSEHRLPEALSSQVRVSLPGTVDIAPVLCASDVVVTKNSTVGLEGLLLGKKLATLDFLLPEAGRVYSRLGLSAGIAAPTHLDECLSKLEGTPTCRHPLLEPAGGAAERVCRIIEDLVDA